MFSEDLLSDSRMRALIIKKDSVVNLQVETIEHFWYTKGRNEK